MWERLAQTLDLAPLIQDERFRTVSDRMAHREELARLLEEKLAARDTAEWVLILEKAGVANGPILHIDEVFGDPQVLHQEMLLEMAHPLAGAIKTLGFPIKMSRTPGALKLPPPLLGQHTEEVLQELGYASSEIAAMREEGVT
jgi:formyl-CoA transferase/CoA:oxalate CoA-transferase